MTTRPVVPLNDCYIYVLFREDGSPFYVGKGRLRRWHDHERDAVSSYRRVTYKIRIIRQMFATGWAEIPKVKVAEGLTNEQASSYERAFIAAIGRHPHGPLTNQTDGGEGLVNPSDEIRARLRAHQLGVPMTEKNRAALAKANTGFPLDAVHRDKISATLTGHAVSEETRDKMRQERLGKPGHPHTIEAKTRISSKLRGRVFTEETLDKMRLAKLGGTLSDEHKAKIGASHLGKKRSPEARAKMSAAAIGKIISAEQRLKISNTLKARNRKTIL